MKKFNYLSLLIILLVFFTTPNNLFANYKESVKEGDNGKGKKPVLQKTSADNPTQSLLNVNNATMWVTDAGYHDWVVASSWNGAFPNGQALGAIFTQGVVWGGQVNDGGSQLIRVGGNTYGSGTAGITRLFRVRSDYQKADLKNDAATFNDIPVSSVTDADVEAIKAQYLLDWKEWPVNEGAPYENRDGVPGYQPDQQGRTDDAVDTSKHFDIPGIPGATQTIFVKYDDSQATSLFGANQIGMEVSEVYWAYSASGPLANVIFDKVTLVYKGLPSSAANSVIDSMYIAMMSDPDVGTSSDDFAGCDTLLNLGYAYSSKTTDATYAGAELPPPAVGYDYLQGVSKFTGNPNDSAIFDLKWRKGYKYVNNVPMSSFVYFASGGTWSDPTEGSYGDGALAMYNLMRGVLPRPPYPAGSPFPDNVFERGSGGGVYLLPGDPVAGTGKIDGTVDGPSDRRILPINGPFTMNLGDTAQVVVATVYGMGVNNLSSISVLKFNDASAQFAYDQLFNVPLMPTPEVTYQELNGEISTYWNNAPSEQNATEVLDHGPYKFQAYAVYQLPAGSKDVSTGTRIATFDVVDGVSFMQEKVLDQSTGIVYTRPLIPLENVSGISRTFIFDKDYINNKALINGQSYTFAITSIGYNDDPGLPSFILESAPYILNVTPQETMGYTYNDKTGNEQTVTHSSGVADATSNVVIVDPAKTNGHNYEIYFTKQQEVRDANGNWVSAGVDKLKKPGDLTGTTINIAGLYGPNPASGVQLSFTLDMVSPTDAWCDGVSITFPAGVEILSAPSFEAGGGTVTPEIVGQTINFGDVTQSNTQNGIFHGGETWDIFISPPALPLDIEWTAFDDTYGNPTADPVNASGTFTLTTIGELSRTAKYWNLRDVTAGVVNLQNQSVIDGVDLFPKRDDLETTYLGTTTSPIVDGFRVNVSGSWLAPTTFSTINPPQVNGTKMSSGSRWTSTNFILTDFIYFGYADGTADASLGAYFDGSRGSTDVTQLQQDLELRWTGVMGDTTINGVTIKVTKSGGSLITLAGASGYSIADHPLNPNPGSTDPFTIRVPFEIWNVDANQEITAIMWDRSGNPTVNGGTSFMTTNREYLWVVNVPNSATPLDPASQTVADHATWNLTLYQSTYNLGDVLSIYYDNPLLPGTDTFTFNTNGSIYSVTTVKSQVDKINVFPNPYYGYQYRETSPTSKYVTFNHLPDNAIIRIFDLSGVLVKTINHVSTNGQFDTWNLTNDNNYPVASGVYIVYVDMPDLGTTKILKLAIIQEQQMLKVY